MGGAFASAFQQYLRRDLRYESEASYETLSLPVASNWDYSRVTNRYLYAADNLRSAITANPDLKVFVASGLFDLVTTSLATRYTVDHLGLDPRLRGNVSISYYPAGHMMYMHEPSLRQLKSDLATLLPDDAGAEAAGGALGACAAEKPRKDVKDCKDDTDKDLSSFSAFLGSWCPCSPCRPLRP